MSQVSISQLPAATNAYDGDVTAVVQDGTTKKMSRKTLLGSGNNSVTFHEGDLVQPVAFGYYNTASGRYAVAVGNSNNLCDYNNSALGDFSSAIGYANTASCYNGVVVGKHNIASGYFDNTAVGISNQAVVAFDTTLGVGNVAQGGGSTAIGYGNVAAGSLAFAAGKGSQATGNRSIAIGISGDSPNHAAGTYSIAFGYGNNALGDNNVFIGAYNRIAGNYNNIVQIGHNNSVTSSTYNVVSVGLNNVVQGFAGYYGGYGNHVAIGTNNDVLGDKVTAIGYNNVAHSTYDSAIAIGSQNNANNTSTALGRNNTASGYSSMVFGHSSTATSGQGLSVGSSNTNNGGQSAVVGNFNYLNADHSSVFGSYNYIQVGDKNAVFGNNNSGHRTMNSVLVGNWNFAKPHINDPYRTISENGGNVVVALGVLNNTSGTGYHFDGTGGYMNGSPAANDYIGRFSTAIGLQNKAKSDYSSAVGIQNTAHGKYAMTAGGFNYASGYVSQSFGQNNTAKSSFANAFGFNNYVSSYGGNAFGSNNRIGSTSDFFVSPPGGINFALQVDNGEWGASGAGSLLGDNQFVWSFSGDPSSDIAFQDFGFSVPSGAVIKGVEVAVQWHCTSLVSDAIAELIFDSGDVTFSANKANEQNGGHGGHGFSGTTIYGGPEDTWGLPIFVLTPGLVNDASFGFDFGLAGADGENAGITYLTVKVYYNFGNSTAVGNNNAANGPNSHVFGGWNFTNPNSYGAVSFGLLNNAYSFSFSGYNGQLTGFPIARANIGAASIAVGVENTTSGYYNTGIGNNNSVTGNYGAIGIGNFNTSSNGYSVAIGYANTASGSSATAIGYNNVAPGQNSLVFGNRSNASGLNSMSFGFENFSTDQGAATFGAGNNATSKNSMAFGRSNTVNGQYGHAFGQINAVNGKNALAVGRNLTVNGDYAVSVGNNSENTAQWGHTFGSYNTVTGIASTSVGYGNNVGGARSNTFGIGNNVNGVNGPYGGDNTQANPQNIQDSNFINNGVPWQVGGLGILPLGEFWQVNTTGAQFTDDIWFNFFGFNIPTYAYILGFEVKITWSTGTAFNDALAALTFMGDGVAQSNNLATGSNTGGDTFTYGGQLNTWGVSWTPSMVNDPSFGFVFQANSQDTGSATITDVQITVYYDLSHSTVVGINNQVYSFRNSVFGEYNFTTTNGNVSVGLLNGATNFDLSADGTIAPGEGGVQASNNGALSTTVGINNKAGRASVAVGYRNTAGDYNVAFGAYNLVVAPGAVSLGVGNGNFGGQSTTVGTNNVGNGYRSLAGGYNNTASGDYSTAIGHNAHTIGNYSVAIGNNVHSNGSSGVAIGANAYAINNSGVAVGYNTTAFGTGATALGWGARAGINYTTTTTPIITRADIGEDIGKEFNSFGGVQNILMSKNVDLTKITDVQVNIPANASFYVDEIGIVTNAATNVTVQPTVKFGDEVVGSAGSPALVQNVSANGTSNVLSISWPNPTVQGNLLVATINVQGNGPLQTNPPGWTLASVSNINDVNTYVFYIEDADVRSGDELTFSFSSMVSGPGSGGWWISLSEWSGITHVYAIDQILDGAGGPTNTIGVTTSPGALAQPVELVIMSAVWTGTEAATSVSSGTILDQGNANSAVHGLIAYQVTSTQDPVAIQADLMNLVDSTTTVQVAFVSDYSKDDLNTATLTTGLTAPRKRYTTDPNNADGHTILTAGVTVPATADTLIGRFYWKGILIED